MKWITRKDIKALAFGSELGLKIARELISRKPGLGQRVPHAKAVLDASREVVIPRLLAMLCVLKEVAFTVETELAHSGILRERGSTRIRFGRDSSDSFRARGINSLRCRHSRRATATAPEALASTRQTWWHHT